MKWPCAPQHGLARPGYSRDTPTGRCWGKLGIGSGLEQGEGAAGSSGDKDVGLGDSAVGQENDNESKTETERERETHITSGALLGR